MRTWRARGGAERGLKGATLARPARCGTGTIDRKAVLPCGALAEAGARDVALDARPLHLRAWVAPAAIAAALAAALAEEFAYLAALRRYLLYRALAVHY